MDELFTANVVKEYLLLQSQLSIAVFTKQTRCNIAIYRVLHYSSGSCFYCDSVTV